MSRIVRSSAALFFFALTLAAQAARAPQPTRETSVRPGFNLFTPEQDIELGRQSAAQVEQQIPIVTDPSVEGYVAAIGRRLAAAAPGPKFPYQFKVTNLSDVNAFALPGGFMYVNRGLIELVPTEGQLAGVMAHEMGHVALRHQTNQVSKAYLAQAGVGILGGLLGHGGGSPSAIMQAVGGLGLNALFLKFSRTAEQQADIVGTQMMARAGYDPHDMARMFEMLRQQAGRDPGRLEQFFSDHPAPADREASVRREASRLGPVRPVAPAGDLQAVKGELRRLSPAVSMQQVARGGAPQGGGPTSGTRTAARRIEAPSSRLLTYRQRNGFFQIDYPENWRPYEGSAGYGVTIAPREGVVETEGGPQTLVYGVVVNHYDPFEGSIAGRSPASGGPVSGQTSLEGATNDLVRQLTLSNPHLRPLRGSERRRTIGGARALSLVLSGTSPATGLEERVTVFTRQLPDEHVLYSLFVAPGRDYAALSPTFERMISSLAVDDRAIHR